MVRCPEARGALGLALFASWMWWLAAAVSGGEIQKERAGWLFALDAKNESTSFSTFLRNLLPSYHKDPLSLVSSLAGWGPYFGYPLSEAMLKKSSLYNGTLSVMFETFLSRLIESNSACKRPGSSSSWVYNEHINILYAGGSVTVGKESFSPSCARKQRSKKQQHPCRTNWADMMVHSLRLSHPCVDFNIFSMAVEGSTMATTKDTAIPHVMKTFKGKVDLFIIDYVVNEGHLAYADYYLSAHEDIVRKMLALEHTPAILYFETMSPMAGFLYNTQENHAKIARHYDLPMISYLDVVWPFYDLPLWDYNSEGLRKNARSGLVRVANEDHNLQRREEIMLAYLSEEELLFLKEMSGNTSSLFPICKVCRFYWSNNQLVQTHPGWYSHQLMADVILFNIFSWQRQAMKPSHNSNQEGLYGRQVPSSSHSNVHTNMHTFTLPGFMNPGVEALQKARCRKAIPDWVYSADQMMYYAPESKKNKNKAVAGILAKRGPPIENTSQWKLMEDVAGKPGWIIEGYEKLGGRVSFPISCPGSITVQYLRSYDERMGNARAYFSSVPLAFWPLDDDPIMTSNDSVTTAAVTLQGTWDSKTSQAHEAKLFCAAANGHRPRNVKMRQKRNYLTIDFAPTLNSNRTSDTSPKFKLLAVYNFACNEAQPKTVEQLHSLQISHDLVAIPI